LSIGAAKETDANRKKEIGIQVATTVFLRGSCQIAFSGTGDEFVEMRVGR
jgi:hypothetical protein